MKRFIVNFLSKASEFLVILILIMAFLSGLIGAGLPGALAGVALGFLACVLVFGFLFILLDLRVYLKEINRTLIDLKRMIQAQTPEDQGELLPDSDTLETVRECPKCGASYRLSDYREDAKTILCSECKSPLPRD